MGRYPSLNPTPRELDVRSNAAAASIYQNALKGMRSCANDIRNSLLGARSPAQ